MLGGTPVLQLGQSVNKHQICWGPPATECEAGYVGLIKIVKHAWS